MSKFKYPKPFKPDGNDCYYISFRVNGKQKLRSTGKKSLRDATPQVVQAIVDAEIKKVNDRADADKSTLLGDVGKRYMDLVGKFHKGADNTQRLIDLVISFPSFGPTKDMLDITHEDVLALRAWRSEHLVPGTKRKVSVYTINDTVEQLKKLFTFLKNNGVQFGKHTPNWKGRENQMASSLWLREPKAHVRILTDDETDALEGAILSQRPDLWDLFDWWQHTGKRKTVSFELEWKKHVKEELGHIELVGKGDKRSIVKIDDVIGALLDRCRGHHPKKVFTRVAQKSFDKWTTYRRKDGTSYKKRHTEVKGERYPWTKESLRNAWQTVCKAAGLTGDKRMRIHDLKHDHISRIISKARNNADAIKLAQEAGDHADPAFTLEVYGHLLPTALGDVRKQMADERLTRRRARIKMVKKK
jgi:integrase